MKRIAYFIFLAALLSGCAPNYTSGGNEISIRIKNGARNSYDLLSVRDSSLVVKNASDDAEENSFTHAEVIGFDSIYMVYRKPYRLIKNETANSIVAGSIGAGLDIATYFLIKGAPKDNRGLDGSIRIETYILAFTTGFLGTALLLKAIFPTSSVMNSVLFTIPDKELHPHDPEDKEFLRSISRYPTAEPEMLKLVH